MLTATIINTIGVTAYFFLSCLFFWLTRFSGYRSGALLWAAASACMVLSRLNFMIPAPVLNHPEITYATLSVIANSLLAIGLLQFFQQPEKHARILIALSGAEIFLLFISGILLTDRVWFALQFSIFNVCLLIFLARLCYQCRRQFNDAYLTATAALLIVYALLWASYPIARTDELWLRTGYIAGNLMNLIFHLNLALLLLHKFRIRLTAAEHAAMDFAKQALASNNAKGLFLANMSHEIRTPLNGVIGMLNQLKKSPLNTQQKKQTAVALMSADNLLVLINDILDFSRIEAGRLEIERSNFDLLRHLENCLSPLYLFAEDKGLELSLDTTHIEVLSVYGDHTRISQIVTNLVTNAIKFTTRGTISIKAWTVSQSADEIIFYCEVSDTGIGISDQDSAFLFDPFTQADASTTRKHGGTGLGLAISKHLAELMDGGILTTSHIGIGSTFTLQLPLTITRDFTSENSFSPTLNTSQRSSTEQCRFLVVEDNQINQMVACDMLEDLDIAYIVANNGKEALETLRALPDASELMAILMDCQMPHMDGYDATREIRLGAAGEAYKNIPIIAMTANAMQGDKEKCLDAGMTDYCTKPIEEKDLIAALNRSVPFFQNL